jgi:uncharacterized glyoxalase superfamily protein PhnB
MVHKVTPMIHVPDVAATVEWYREIGFAVQATYGRDGPGLSFAILSFGTTQVMFNQGGHPGTGRRRDVDLYIHMEGVDSLFEQLKDRVEVIEGLRDTFYGMREITVRDLNGFWITFGEDSPFGVLMDAIRAGNPETVRDALERDGINAQSLTTALVTATSGDSENAVIAELLRKAGAVLPPIVDGQILESHAGHYKDDMAMEVDMVVKDGQLFAVPKGAEPISLVAIDNITFRPLIFDAVTVTFRVEGGKTVGFQFKQGSQTKELKRS